jgi:flagellar motor protein MotB
MPTTDTLIKTKVLLALFLAFSGCANAKNDSLAWFGGEQKTAQTEQKKLSQDPPIARIQTVADPLQHQRPDNNLQSLAMAVEAQTVGWYDRSRGQRTLFGENTTAQIPQTFLTPAPTVIQPPISPATAALRLPDSSVSPEQQQLMESFHNAGRRFSQAAQQQPQQQVQQQAWQNQRQTYTQQPLQGMQIQQPQQAFPQRGALPADTANIRRSDDQNQYVGNASVNGLDPITALRQATQSAAAEPMRLAGQTGMENVVSYLERSSRQQAIAERPVLQASAPVAAQPILSPAPTPSLKKAITVKATKPTVAATAQADVRNVTPRAAVLAKALPPAEDSAIPEQPQPTIANATVANATITNPTIARAMPTDTQAATPAPRTAPLSAKTTPEPMANKIVDIATLYFEGAASNFNTEDRNVLDQVAELHRQHGGVVQIAGFATPYARDGNRRKADDTNAIARNHATATANALMDRGIPLAALSVRGQPETLNNPATAGRDATRIEIQFKY